MSDAANESDEDLKLAIALSLSEASAAQANPSHSASGDAMPSMTSAGSASKSEPLNTFATNPHSTAPTASGQANFLSDRAALEKERLARQKRRLESASAADGRPSKRARPTAPASATSASSPSATKTSLMDVDVFLDGEIRQNRNAHVPKNPARPVFGMAEILAPASGLQFVLISAFGTDFNWLSTLIPKGVPMLSVNHPTENERWEPRIKPIGPDGWIYVTPKMNKGGIMHVKLMMLFYKDGRLRLVIPTANLIPEDWRDIENTVFLQDIPPIPDPPSKAHDFPIYVASFLKLLNVQNGLKALLQGGYPDLSLPSLDVLVERWDWSRVIAKPVGSPQGNYEGWDHVRKWGHPRLGEAVRQLAAQPPKGKALQFEYQGSSIGNYTTQYLNEFYKSACGLSPQSWLDTPKAKLKNQPWPPVQIVFPTLQTVDNAVLGRLGAGSFFCKKQYWQKSNAPRKLFRDSRARSGRVLMHTKMIVGTYVDVDDNRISSSTSQSVSRKGKGPTNAKGKAKLPEPESDTEPELSDADEATPVRGWLYVGSHNFSMAAWGSLSGTSSKPKLWISNFELGIVLPVRDETWLDRVVPWERPAKEYSEADVPWMQDEHLLNMPGLQALLQMSAE